MNRLEIGDVAERYPVVILAAGSSRRMGRPKALLDFGGSTCLDLAIGACREAGQGPLIVVLGGAAGEILARLRPAPDLHLVINPDHERGQTSSVKAGLRVVGAAAPGLFVLPVDHPLVAAADIDALAQGFSRRAPGKSMWIPTYRGRRGHPLLLAGAHRMGILAMDDVVPLHDHVRSRATEIENIERPGSGVITGINTEADYMRALAMYRER